MSIKGFNPLNPHDIVGFAGGLASRRLLSLFYGGSTSEGLVKAAVTNAVFGTGVKGSWPTSAAQAALVVGQSTLWDAAYSFNIPSGNPTQLFGTGVPLSASGTVNYGKPGPFSDDGPVVDLAVSLGTSGSGGSAASSVSYDVTTGSITLAWLLWVGEANQGVSGFIVDKEDATPIGYSVQLDSTSGLGIITFNVSGVTSASNLSISDIPRGQWHVGLASFDGASTVARLGIVALGGGGQTATATKTVGSQTNGDKFTVLSGLKDDVRLRGVLVSTQTNSTLVASSGNFSAALESLRQFVVDNQLEDGRETGIILPVTTTQLVPQQFTQLYLPDDGLQDMVPFVAPPTFMDEDYWQLGPGPVKAKLGPLYPPLGDPTDSIIVVPTSGVTRGGAHVIQKIYHDPNETNTIGGTLTTPATDLVVSSVTAGTDILTFGAAHGMITSEGPYTFTTTGTLPGGLSLATKYWMVRSSSTDIKVATSGQNATAGTVVDITSSGTGTHTLVRVINTAAFGSTFLVYGALGTWASSPNAPTDNKGNALTALAGSPIPYVSFAASSAGVWGIDGRSSVGGSAHTASKTWVQEIPGTTSNSDEPTVGIIELVGGLYIKSATQKETAVGSASITSNSVTVDGPALLVGIIFGNGGIGQSHAFTWGSGFTRWDEASSTADTHSNGYIQVDVATKEVSAAGTYSFTANGVSNEGGEMWLFAIQSVQQGQPDEDFWTTKPAPVAARQYVLLPLVDTDDPTTLTGQYEDDSWLTQPRPISATQYLTLPLVSSDEDQYVTPPIIPVYEDDSWLVIPRPIAATQFVSVPLVDTDDPTTLNGQYEDDSWLVKPRPVAATQYINVPLVDTDDPTTLTGQYEDDSWLVKPRPVAATQYVSVPLVDTDDPTTLTGQYEDDSWLIKPRPVAATQYVSVPLIDTDDPTTLFGQYEDDSWLVKPRPVTATQYINVPLVDTDDPTTLTGQYEDDSWLLGPRVTTTQSRLYYADVDDFVPPPATIAVEDDSWTVQPRPVTPAQSRLYFADVDDFVLPPPATIVVEDDSWLVQPRPATATQFVALPFTDTDAPGTLTGQYEDDSWLVQPRPVTATQLVVLPLSETDVPGMLTGQYEDDSWLVKPSPVVAALFAVLPLADTDVPGTLTGQYEDDSWLVKPSPAFAAMVLRLPALEADDAPTAPIATVSEEYWINSVIPAVAKMYVVLPIMDQDNQPAGSFVGPGDAFHPSNDGGAVAGDHATNTTTSGYFGNATTGDHEP